MTGCVRAVCLASRLVNESTGGRHPSHAESDPASLRLYCQRLALLQVRINGVTSGASRSGELGDAVSIAQSVFDARDDNAARSKRWNDVRVFLERRRALRPPLCRIDVAAANN